MAVNTDKLNTFMGKPVGDMGPAMSANIVLLGDKLGLYNAMAKEGPVTLAELQRQQRQLKGTSVGIWANKSQVDT
jgi:hypothetical protein